jgi:uncharacterized protein with HEPN domain
MQLETRGLLWDIQQAGRAIRMFVAGKSDADFLGDLLLRSAVERQFEILGEAMTRLAKRDPQTAERISEFRRIIGFRNVLIHGYDQVDDQTTWRIVQDKLPILIQECDSLLALPEDDQPPMQQP